MKNTGHKKKEKSRMCLENKNGGKGHKARKALADSSLPHLGDKNE